jgi:hypothetical protein
MKLEGFIEHNFSTHRGLGPPNETRLIVIFSQTDPLRRLPGHGGFCLRNEKSHANVFGVKKNTVFEFVKPFLKHSLSGESKKEIVETAIFVEKISLFGFLKIMCLVPFATKINF